MKDDLVNKSGDLVNDLVNDTISRAAALDALDKVAEMFPYRIPGKAKTYRQYNEAWSDAIDAAENALEALPSAQLAQDLTNGCTDTISKAAVVDAIEGVDWYHQNDSGEMVHGANSDEHQAWYKAEDIYKAIEALPSAQSNLSEAYSKAVFTWLMDYQIRAAELKGRYTPYEVLSWVVNDWRKEHERFD